MESTELTRKIKLILETPKGSVPHTPEFGSLLYQHLDKCANLARPLIIAETYQALKLWLPDFKLIKITYKAEEDSVYITILGTFEDKTVEVLHGLT